MSVGDEVMAGDPVHLKRRLARLAVVGSSLALIVTWGTLIPIKLSGPMPAHMTWPVIVLFPPTGFGWLVGLIVLSSRYPRRPLAVIFGVSFVVVAIEIAVIAFCTPGGLHGSKDLPWK